MIHLDVKLLYHTSGICQTPSGLPVSSTREEEYILLSVQDCIPSGIAALWHFAFGKTEDIYLHLENSLWWSASTCLTVCISCVTNSIWSVIILELICIGLHLENQFISICFWK